MNEEKFRLWRLALSCIHIDGEVTDQEIFWFEKKIDYLSHYFSSEQIVELKGCLHKPVNHFYEEFQALKKPADRAFLLHILNIINNIDGVKTSEEIETYKKLEQMIMGSLDIGKIEKITSEMEEHDTQEELAHPMSTKDKILSTVEALDESVDQFFRGLLNNKRGK